MNNFTKVLFVLLLGVAFLTSCSDLNRKKITFDEAIRVTVSNPVELMRVDELVSVDIKAIKSLHPQFNENAFVLRVDDNEIPSQVYDSNLDGEDDQILFNVYLQPNEERDLTFNYSKDGNVKTEYKNRTYAELAVKVDYTKEDGVYKGGRFENVSEFRVPDDHKDHNNLFKYEGPGWESEKVGYRFYLDWRNATDIFGKKVNELVLHKVGLKDVTGAADSYHQMADWGMDILKVGSTLGIGSIATWHDDKINMISKTDSVHWKLLCNGPLLSEFQTTYYGWEVGDKKRDLYARTSIAAGSRLTKIHLLIDGDIDNIVTGFARHDAVPEMIKSDDDGGWQYISSYGKQSLSDDDLGIAVIYNNDYTQSLENNDDNHFVVIETGSNSVEYYFAAVWEKEYEPVKGRLEFIEYLQQTEIALNNPIRVKIN